ncbi:DUF6286 domain-containing protein [Kitasatospora sp. MAP5-34]|uniref:DUF6286 domain-containing protein n=1 Tax=Kitasatospora sp. MAP5-34 TaxID=3035102 RepID=UPI00247677CF|nr:DUF6286 domain-containing protein [Kitasatospora sp. MAP5-34]MDH6578488.1 hypothetical protein [Kitasatospora sp. MAP5-34]
MTADQLESPPEDDQIIKGRRLRSPRTFGAVLISTAVLVVAGGLLSDVVAVRTGHRARPWRADLAHQLATRHLDDPWVRLGAGVAVLLGLWCCLLALTPGLRRWLPLSRPGSAIDRAGVAALLAHRAEEYPGVASVKVRVGQGSTKVTLQGTADPAGLERGLRAELARIPLALPNRLDVRARSAGRRQR